jgi:hypothetical protein
MLGAEVEQWPMWALWAARALWAAGSAACLLASDLPLVGVDALRRTAHYGKLRSEAAAPPPAGPFSELQVRLARLSVAPRTAWTAYYVVGAVLNTACLFWEVRSLQPPPRPAPPSPAPHRYHLVGNAATVETRG